LFYLVIKFVKANVALAFFVRRHLDLKVVVENASSLAFGDFGDVISPKKKSGILFQTNFNNDTYAAVPPSSGFQTSRLRLQSMSL